MTRCYIAGPMTGYPDLNFPAFEHAETLLAEAGFVPISPHRIPQGETARQCMCNDIPELIKCEAIHLLEGWSDSIGARCEVAIAITLNLGFVSVEGRAIQRPPYVVVYKGHLDRGHNDVREETISEVITRRNS